MSAFYDILIVFILSISPISEVRGAIIYGVLAGLDAWVVFITSIVGNMFIAVILWVFLSRLGLFFKRRVEKGSEDSSFFSRIARLYSLYEKRVSMRVQPYTQRYGALGLAVFVAVPLPLTGAWTASFAAFALGIRQKMALVSILVGIVGAAVIVLIITMFLEFSLIR